MARRDHDFLGVRYQQKMKSKLGFSQAAAGASTAVERLRISVWQVASSKEGPLAPELLWTQEKASEGFLRTPKRHR